MKIIYWNVNGLRSALSKGLKNFVLKEKPDIICLQEIKTLREQIPERDLTFDGKYNAYILSAKRKGYSGVATFVKADNSPLNVEYKIGHKKSDQEGRFLMSSFKDFDLYNIYFPSGTSGDDRQRFKYKFLDCVYDYFASLDKKKFQRSIICGDFNICHKEIDIHHPEKAEKLKLTGFLPRERRWMDKFTELGFIDTFRHVNGDGKNYYTWWSYRANARAKNLGWRIDYIFCAAKFRQQIRNARILSDIRGSDHCPISLELQL